jgi:hypothetical protein
MLRKYPERRVTIPDILDGFSDSLPSGGISNRITVKYSMDGSKDELMVRLPYTSTVQDFVDSVVRPSEVRIGVELNGRPLRPEDRIDTVVNNGTLKIYRSAESSIDPHAQTDLNSAVKVKYRTEHSPDLFIAKMPRFAKVGQLVLLASKSGANGRTVKNDGAFVRLDDPISAWENETLVISSACPSEGPSTSVPELDLVLVIDATHSMKDTIKAAHDYAYDFAWAFRVNRKLQLRIACVCYRDPVDRAADEHQVHPFSPSLLDLRTFLDGVKATGGRDGPEDYVGAINMILGLSWRRTAHHAIVWMADAPAHGHRYCGRTNHQEEEPKLEPLIQDLARQGAAFQGFSIGGGANQTFEEMKKIYASVNPGLHFSFKDFKIGTGSAQERVKTVGSVVTGTLETVSHAFLAGQSVPAKDPAEVPSIIRPRLSKLLAL